MGKRTLLAFFLSLSVIISYNYYLAQKYPPDKQPASEQPVAPATMPLPAAEHQPEPQDYPSAQLIVPAKEVTVETDLFILVITSSGARIKSCQLKKYHEEKVNPQVVQAQLEQIEQTLARPGQETNARLIREKRKLTALREQAARPPKGVELVALSAAINNDFSPTIVWPNDPQASRAINVAAYVPAQDQLNLSATNPQGELEFTYVDASGRQVKKTFSFSNSKYIIGLKIKLVNWPEQGFQLYYGPDIGLPLAQRGRRTYSYEGPVSYLTSGTQGWLATEKYAQNELANFVRREHQGQVWWAGLENKYFLTAVIPAAPAQAVLIEKNKFGEQKVGLKVAPNSSGEYDFQLYLGPKKEKYLSDASVTLEKSIDYGLFSPIARWIYQALVFFFRWTQNFGWAIVLLCLLTKGVFFPFTRRSMEAMQKMQAQMKSIQPETEALREKLRDNPQKLNKEIMELYRRHNINPLSSCQSGCLPMLLQMPVFFALYAVLYNSIELRGAPFLGWVQDLSNKDPYYILPALMGVSMFVQQKLTGLGAAGGMQQEQAKMMVFLLPVFLAWVFASLPSGVVLYWLTFNVATVFGQLLVKRRQSVAADGT